MDEHFKKLTITARDEQSLVHTRQIVIDWFVNGKKLAEEQWGKADAQAQRVPTPLPAPVRYEVAVSVKVHISLIELVHIWLRKNCPSMSENHLVSRNSFHVTVAYVRLAPEELETVGSAIKRALTRFTQACSITRTSPMKLQITGLDVFEDANHRPTVLYAGVTEGSQLLRRLSAEVVGELGERAHLREDSIHHVTVANRSRDPRVDCTYFREAKKHGSGFDFGTEVVNTVQLYAGRNSDWPVPNTEVLRQYPLL